MLTTKVFPPKKNQKIIKKNVFGDKLVPISSKVQDVVREGEADETAAFGH